MQKKIYLLTSLLVLIAFSLRGQNQPVNLLAFVYNDVLLDSNSSYSSIAACSPSPDFSMRLDSSLIPFATGMTVVAVVTEVNVPQPGSLISSYGAVAVGDVLPFDTTDQYPFYFNAGGSMKWDWRAVGTPTEIFETFNCIFNVLQTLGSCTNGVILEGSAATPLCFVQAFESIEDGKSLGWELYPSPSEGPMRLRHKDGITQWESADLSDIRGRTIRHWEAGEEINTSGLESGVYFLKATSLSIPFVFRIMVE